MKLIIVESPTKARTLTKFFGNKYTVRATMGHIRDLPKATLGVDIDHDFEPKYVIPKDRSKTVTELKDLSKKADQVIIATDPDREGEAIAWHVQAILSGEKSTSQNSDSKFSRISFHEITETAVKDALSHPGTIDLKLVDAQTARRVLDRLVGYKLSPLLWQKLSKRWLSAGRVQSVTVRLLVEREREIKAFLIEPFFTIDGVFQTNLKETIPTTLKTKDNIPYEITKIHTLFDGNYTVSSSTIKSKEQAESIIADLQTPFTITSVDKKQIIRNPLPPYTTSTLQQDAGGKLYYSSKKTMQLAQHLYEQGLITYHRTDSVNLSEKFIGEARSFIEQKYGKQFVAENPRRFKTKSKVAQEAHEAIRPTDIGRTLSDLPRRQSGKGDTSGLHKDHAKLYDIIWKRAVASQASSAIFDSTTIDISSKNGYVFETQGSVIVFEGYLAITGRNNDEIELPKVANGDTVMLFKATVNEKTTKPPPRYTEAKLVKTLEEKGIGRPSTYAPTVSTIQDRQYAVREDKVLVPTVLGGEVTDFLVKYFPNVMDPPFTAKLEDKLDAIANGELSWKPVIAEFYGPFEEALDSTFKDAEKVKTPETLIDEKCPDCGKQLSLKIGRYGKFIACTGFPACKYTRQFAELLDIECPKCKSKIVVKKTRRGKTFFGCSNYPNCTFAAWKKEDIK
jgi:DNA topoisomerase I